MAAILISTGNTDSDDGFERAGRKNSGSFHTHQISPRGTITPVCAFSWDCMAFLKLLLSLARQSGSFKIETENEEILEMSLLL